MNRAIFITSLCATLILSACATQEHTHAVRPSIVSQYNELNDAEYQQNVNEFCNEESPWKRKVLLWKIRSKARRAFGENRVRVRVKCSKVQREAWRHEANDKEMKEGRVWIQNMKRRSGMH